MLSVPLSARATIQWKPVGLTLWVRRSSVKKAAPLSLSHLPWRGIEWLEAWRYKSLRLRRFSCHSNFTSLPPTLQPFPTATRSFSTQVRFLLVASCTVHKIINESKGATVKIKAMKLLFVFFNHCDLHHWLPSNPSDLQWRPRDSKFRIFIWELRFSLLAAISCQSTERYMLYVLGLLI